MSPNRENRIRAGKVATGDSCRPKQAMVRDTHCFLSDFLLGILLIVLLLSTQWEVVDMDASDWARKTGSQIFEHNILLCFQGLEPILARKMFLFKRLYPWQLLWWLILCSTLLGHGYSDTWSWSFWVCLGRCFWIKLIFELENWVKKIVFLQRWLLASQRKAWKD